MEQWPVIPRRKTGDDNIIPMINIVFLLLIFFMIAGQIKEPLNGEILLPHTPLGEPAEKMPITLEMDRQLRLSLNGRGIAIEALEERVRSLLREGQTVALLVDRQVAAGDLDRVLTVLREIGVAHIRLYSQPDE
jgi:biopolymer transport protein ExbD